MNRTIYSHISAQFALLMWGQCWNGIRVGVWVDVGLIY